MAANVRNNQPQVRHVVGVMTGTSIDGIDAALVRIDGRGLELTATLIASTSLSLDPLGAALQRAARQEPMTAGDFARLAWDFGRLHTRILTELVKPGQPVDLICMHGQTVFHQPPISWQLLNPAPVTELFGCSIVFDLRQADLVAGGQGAPITPIADWILFRHPSESRAVINLGGFVNATILPPDQAPPPMYLNNLERIRGFDVCACNQVLDAVSRSALNRPFDMDGKAASSGKAQDVAVDALVRILDRQRRGGSSLGTGDEASSWVADFTQRLSPADLCASAVLGVARCVADSIGESGVNRVILAGGGVRNLALRSAISSCARGPVQLSDDFGVPAHAREAMAFAVLGALCADGIPITLPRVTGGSPAPVSGVWCLPRSFGIMQRPGS